MNLGSENSETVWGLQIIIHLQRGIQMSITVNKYY